MAQWSLEAVKKWIEDCRRSGGIPVFRVKGESAVLAVCHGGSEPDELFENVPPEVVELHRKYKGEWKLLLALSEDELKKMASIGEGKEKTLKV